MEEVEKKIAEWLAMRFVYGRDNEFNPVNYLGLSESQKSEARKDAAQILDTTFGVGACANCLGRGVNWWRNGLNEPVSETCPTCNGTGQATKTLRQISKEARDGRT